MLKGFTYTRKVTRVKNISIKLDCCLMLRSCCLFLIPNKPEWNQFTLKQDISLPNEFWKKQHKTLLQARSNQSLIVYLLAFDWAAVKLSCVVFGCQMKSCVRPWDVLIGDICCRFFFCQVVFHILRIMLEINMPLTINMYQADPYCQGHSALQQQFSVTSTKVN